jgi:hypothetical protein
MTYFKCQNSKSRLPVFSSDVNHRDWTAVDLTVANDRARQDPTLVPRLLITYPRLNGARPTMTERGLGQATKAVGSLTELSNSEVRPHRVG